MWASSPEQVADRWRRRGGFWGPNDPLRPAPDLADKPSDLTRPRYGMRWLVFKAEKWDGQAFGHPAALPALTGGACFCFSCGATFRAPKTFARHLVAIGKENRCLSAAEMRKEGFRLGFEGHWRKGDDGYWRGR